MRIIGKNIKNIRQTRHMTQEALADALFVTRQTVSNYENGRSRPDLDMLLKIAQTLDTDVDAILYGPPVPQSKKEAYRWAAICAGLLAVVWIAYFGIRAAFSTNNIYAAHVYAIRAINLQTLLPLGMFLLGWSLLHGLSLLRALRQFDSKKARLGKHLLLAIGGVAAIIPLPYTVWFVLVTVRSLTSPSIAMSFPYIPVYQAAYNGIISVIRHAPFAYTLLGGAFWLFGIPCIKKKSDSSQDSGETDR